VGIKRIYTSYFNHIYNHLELLEDCFSIARFNPSWYTGEVIFELRPSTNLLYAYKTGAVTDTVYTYQYNQMLNELNREEILSKIPDGSILLCYELPGRFCHRHLAADWFNGSGLVNVKELDYINESYIRERS